MKKISFVVDQPYQKNKIFDKSDPTRVKYYKLKEIFLQNGFEFNTCDYYQGSKVDVSISMDIPDQLAENYTAEKYNYAILIESPLVKLNNLNISLHDKYKKIYTWSNDLVNNNDSDKYLKIYYAFDFKRKYEVSTRKEKLCSMVVSYKNSSEKKELYSKRKEVIRWFEKNHPNEFDLYGRGWHRLFVCNCMNRFQWIKILNEYFGCFPSYRGAINNKFEILSSRFIHRNEKISIILCIF